MKLIEPKVELWSEENISQESHIARCAHVCYGKKVKLPDQNADKKMVDGLIKHSHMSLTNTLKVAKRIDLHATREILLIHLSDGNSDDRKFVREMRAATGKRCYAAHAGLRIEYNITPNQLSTTGSTPATKQRK